MKTTKNKIEVQSKFQDSAEWRIGEKTKLPVIDIILRESTVYHTVPSGPAAQRGRSNSSGTTTNRLPHYFEQIVSILNDPNSHSASDIEILKGALEKYSYAQQQHLVAD